MKKLLVIVMVLAFASPAVCGITVYTADGTELGTLLGMERGISSEISAYMIYNKQLDAAFVIDTAGDPITGIPPGDIMNPRYLYFSGVYCNARAYIADFTGIKQRGIVRYKKGYYKTFNTSEYVVIRSFAYRTSTNKKGWECKSYGSAGIESEYPMRRLLRIRPPLESLPVKLPLDLRVTP